MKALNLWQPWAFLCIRPDLTIDRANFMKNPLFVKDIENRPRKWKYTGDVVIVASQKVDPQSEAVVQRVLAEFGIHVPDNLPRGGIVGIVHFDGICTASDSPWFTGPYGFKLSNPRPLPFQAMAGQQGIYNLKPQYERWVNQQLEKV